VNDRSISLALHVLSFAFFALGTASLSVVGALESISTAMQLSRSAVAMLVPAFAVTFAICAPAIQIFVGHWPRRRLLLSGLIVLALGAAGCAVATSYTTLIAARVLTGIGAAAVSPMVSALGSSIVPPARQGHALAVVFAGMTLASIIGVPFASWCAAMMGWRWMFASIALLAVIAAIGIFLVVKDPSHGQKVRLAHFQQLLLNRSTALGLSVTVLGIAALFTTYTMITPILRVRFSATPQAVSLALFIYGLAGLAGNLVARHLATKWTSQRSVQTALGMLITGFMLLYVAPPWFGFALIVLIPWAVAVDVFAPAQQRRMVEMAPEMRGLVLALNSTALFVGISVGAMLASMVTAHWGLMALPLVSIGLALLAMLSSHFSNVPGKS
jgi:predicted MFS family arabinose efflux permease